MTRLPALVSLLLLVSVSSPAAVIVGPEQPLSSPLYGTAPGGHYRPMVASDGGDFLAVWLDGRAGPDYLRQFGTRISGADGAVLDPTGISLPSRLIGDLTFGSGRYAAAASPFLNITPAGEVTEGDTEPDQLIYPVIAASGSRLLIVRGYEQLRGWFVDAQGRLIGDVFSLPTSAGLSGTITPNALAATSGGFVLLYTQGEALFSLGLDLDGHPLGPGQLLEASATIDSSSGPARPVATLASAGGQLLAAWQRLPDWTVVTQRLGVRGEPVGSQNDLHLTSARSPALVHVGESYVLFYGIAASPMLYAVPLDGAGMAAAVPVVISDCAGSELGAASNGTRAYVVWEGAAPFSGASESILGALVDASGHPVIAGDCASRVISRSARGQQALALASLGDRRAAAWIEEGGRGSSTHSVMYREWQGELEPSSPEELEADDYPAVAPSVALTASGSMVTWSSSSGLEARVSESGIEFPPFLLAASAFTSASVASIGERYLAVWLDLHGLQGDVYSSAGAPIARLDRVFPLRTITAPYPPQLACSNDLCVAVWQEEVSLGCFQCYATSVVAARIKADGHVLDESPIALADGVTAAGLDGQVAVATDGDDFLVVWADRSNQLHATSLSSNGQTGTTAGAIIARQALAPAVAWDGHTWVVAWQTIADWGQSDILAARIDARGSLLSSAPIPIATSDLPEAQPNLVRAEGGGVLVGYSRITDEEYGGVWRAFLRTLSPGTRRRAIGRP